MAHAFPDHWATQTFYGKTESIYTMAFSLGFLKSVTILTISNLLPQEIKLALR